MVNKNMKNCSVSIIWEMQIKTIMRYYYITTSMAKIRKTDNTKC